MKIKSPFKMLTLTIAGSCLIAAVVPAVSAASAIPTAVVQTAETTAVSAQLISAINTEAVTLTTKLVEEKTDQYTAKLQIPVINRMLDEHYQDQLNDILERHAMEDFDVIKKEAIEAAADAKANDYTFNPYELIMDYELKSTGSTADGGLLSLMVQTYTYTGGAHGGTRVDTYNVVNEKEASLLTLEKLLGSNYKELANAAVKQAIAAEPERFFSNEDLQFEGIREDQSFFMDKGQAVLVFQQYEIAPYAAGIIEIKVPAKEEAASVRVVRQDKDLIDGPAYHMTEQNIRVVPLREVAEKLGYTVNWSNKTASAEIIQGAAWTSITPGKDYYTYNKMAPIKLGTAPQMIGGVTYVPEAFFNEILKLAVTVEEGTEALIISKS
ncbi:MAG: PdaC/SigV domain-containing protein [Candidatus Pristimantibacillus sp.]